MKILTQRLLSIFLTSINLPLPVMVLLLSALAYKPLIYILIMVEQATTFQMPLEEHVLLIGP
jgi:hypothetical protein